MQLIYLHGFQSSPSSYKAQQLLRICQTQQIVLHIPDLNAPPHVVLSRVEKIITQTSTSTGLLGSSLGGFYAQLLAARHGLPAVLINPAMRPWQLFQQLFDVAQLPYRVTNDWFLDAVQLQQLAEMALHCQPNASQILLLLQSGDEVLDYREAERYYKQADHAALVLRDQGGNHAMDDFTHKIPMVLHFLQTALKAHKG